MYGLPANHRESAFSYWEIRQQWEARARKGWPSDCGSIDGVAFTLPPSKSPSQDQARLSLLGKLSQDQVRSIPAAPTPQACPIATTEDLLIPGVGTPSGDHQESGSAVEEEGQQWSDEEVQGGGQQWRDEVAEGGGKEWSDEVAEGGGQEWSDREVDDRLQRLLGSTWASHRELVARLGVLAGKVTALQDLAEVCRLPAA